MEFPFLKINTYGWEICIKC